MFILLDRILKRAGGFLKPLWLAAAFCAGTAMDVHAQAAPPNQTFATAQGIVGTTGTVYGTNLYIVPAQTKSSESPADPYH